MQAAMIASQADARSLDKTRAQAAVVPAQMQAATSVPSQPEQAAAQMQAAASPVPQPQEATAQIQAPASPAPQPEPAADASKPQYPEIDL